MTAVGHQNAFLRPRLSVCCRFSQATFTRTGGNGRDAPIPDLPGLTPEQQDSTRTRHLVGGMRGREEAVYLVASLASQDFSNSAAAHGVILLRSRSSLSRNDTTRAVSFRPRLAAIALAHH
jgi:hypothetical protein